MPSNTNTKQSQQQQQQAAETFTDPNAELVAPEETIDQEGADLHNKEVLQKQKGSKDSSFVMIKQIFTDPDTEPFNEALSDKERARISGYNAEEYQAELDTEKYAKIGYMIWQSKQLFYTAFRLIGYNEVTKKMEWQQRDYTYHKLTSAQKIEIKKFEGQINSLINKNNLFMRGFVNESLYSFITKREKDIDVEIEELKNELVNKKFSYYFLETDEEVLNDIGFVDKRDLVEAAEYRETGVPFSRKQASYRTMSASAGAKAPSK